MVRGAALGQGLGVGSVPQKKINYFFSSAVLGVVGLAEGVAGVKFGADSEASERVPGRERGGGFRELSTGNSFRNEFGFEQRAF